MSFFCVRDDDVSYFTAPSELESAWGWWPYVVTLGVIPYTVESRYMELPGRDHAYHQLGEAEFALSGNEALCDYLRASSSKYTIAMHGCTHRYQLIDDRLQAEYASSDASFLAKETRRGRDEILRCFGTVPKVFIPPDNAISKAGLQEVHRAGFAYVQTPFPIKPDSLRWFLDYSRSVRSWRGRLGYRLRYNAVDLRICGDAQASISAAILVKFDDESLLQKRLDLAVEKKWPITLATHYWEMGQERYRRKFEGVANSLIDRGLKPVSMESLYCKRDC